LFWSEKAPASRRAWLTQLNDYNSKLTREHIRDLQWAGSKTSRRNSIHPLRLIIIIAEHSPLEQVSMLQAFLTLPRRIFGATPADKNPTTAILWLPGLLRCSSSSVITLEPYGGLRTRQSVFVVAPGSSFGVLLLGNTTAPFPFFQSSSEEKR